jgi:hypothetical protein
MAAGANSCRIGDDEQMQGFTPLSDLGAASAHGASEQGLGATPVGWSNHALSGQNPARLSSLPAISSRCGRHIRA